MTKRKRESHANYVVCEAKTDDVRQQVLWEIIDGLQMAVKDNLNESSLWWYLDDIIIHIKDKQPLFYARDQNGSFAGFLCGKVWEKYDADIFYLEVHPNHRLRSVGSKLVSYFERWCQLQMPRDQVLTFIDVIPMNMSVTRFWSKLGYKQDHSCVWRKYTCDWNRYKRRLKRQKKT